jgi:hypothetical protein
MYRTVSCCFIGFLMAPERQRDEKERQKGEREREKSEQAGEGEREKCELIHGSGVSSVT